MERKKCTLLRVLLSFANWSSKKKWKFYSFSRVINGPKVMYVVWSDMLRGEPTRTYFNSNKEVLWEIRCLFITEIKLFMQELFCVIVFHKFLRLRQVFLCLRMYLELFAILKLDFQFMLWILSAFPIRI